MNLLVNYSLGYLHSKVCQAPYQLITLDTLYKFIDMYTIKVHILSEFSYICDFLTQLFLFYLHISFFCHRYELCIYNYPLLTTNNAVFETVYNNYG